MTAAALHWLELILAERFGHAWHLARVGDSLHLSLEGAEGAIAFDTLQAGFTEAHSNQPFTSWDAEREGWHAVLDGALPAPGVVELPSPLIEPHADGHVVHYDILGLAYWMLARVEEVGRTNLDNHLRFPAIASHAFKHGYLDRPVVDEWLHLLGQVMQRQWPGLVLKWHSPRTLVSCDVDSPFAYLERGNGYRMARGLAGDLLKRRSPRLAWRNVRGQWRARRGVHSLDPHRLGLDLIMDVNERAGRAVAFYFIPENTDPRLDNRASLDDPRMRVLLREIHTRGHEIGIHPGYNTYRHPETMKQSVATLRRVLDEERIQQPILGGRQHYLRWETPTTAALWHDNNLDYDTTLTYADRPGFRCGTCHEYPLFDPRQGRALQLRERPLVLMECSVIARRYLGLGYSQEALEMMQGLRETCQHVGGDFTLLWHNSHLGSDRDRQFYRALLS
ncbi:hypothetical protein F2Q65_11000 [Thiohalocapsa marina]|uniref:DUF7033 domain-containing protein n=1 Tax=Thiohalocapsa marina TaxID=424902 RepID=A0A5M8FQQ1_9GAMM|nr:hypothetical protein F2Q65_11000 [Thiohalocapsa marina]